MGLLDYFSKPRGPETSGLFGHLLDGNEQTQDAADSPPKSEPPIQLAQYLAPFFTLFARAPVIVPRQFTPLEELPRGSAGGDTAGLLFRRSMNQQKPEGTPCLYCGRPTTKKFGPDRHNGDHIIPKSRGGNASPENHADSCQSCNLEKADRTPEEWYLARENGWI